MAHCRAKATSGARRDGARSSSTGTANAAAVAASINQQIRAVSSCSGGRRRARRGLFRASTRLCKASSIRIISLHHRRNYGGGDKFEKRELSNLFYLCIFIFAKNADTTVHINRIFIRNFRTVREWTHKTRLCSEARGTMRTVKWLGCVALGLVLEPEFTRLPSLHGDYERTSDERKLQSTTSRDLERAKSRSFAGCGKRPCRARY